MVTRVLCVLVLGTLVVADEVRVYAIDKSEVSSAEPCDKSLYGKEDLKQIIDFVANSLSIDEKLNDTIQTEAVSVLKKHVQRIKATMVLFSERPEHLKHVLEDVSLTRQQMETSIVKMKKSLDNYSEFSHLYQGKVENAKAILKKLVYYNQLCQLNCGAEKAEVEFRSAVTDPPSDKYCGSIADIHKTIQKQLEKFVNENIQRIHQQINEADKSYNEKVRDRLSDLKDIAFQQFGHTMYDILNLQDQYHHLKKHLKEFNYDYWLMALKTLNIQMDAVLMKLDSVVEYFGAYCQKCNKDRASEPVVYTQKVGAVEKGNLLDSLIDDKLAEIKKKYDAELHTIFEQLDQNLNKTIIDNLFIEHLKPIHKEVSDLTKKEIKAYQNLNVSKLNIDMDLVKQLIANTKDLMNALAKEYQAIVAIIKDLVP